MGLDRGNVFNICIFANDHFRFLCWTLFLSYNTGRYILCYMSMAPMGTFVYIIA